jgi:hypothetical protein
MGQEMERDTIPGFVQGKNVSISGLSQGRLPQRNLQSSNQNEKVRLPGFSQKYDRTTSSLDMASGNMKEKSNGYAPTSSLGNGKSVSSLTSPGSSRFSLSPDRAESGKGMARIPSGNMKEKSNGYAPTSSLNSPSLGNGKSPSRSKLSMFNQVNFPPLDMKYSQFDSSDPEVNRLLADLPTKDLEFNMRGMSRAPLDPMEMNNDVGNMPTFVGNMATYDLEHNFKSFPNKSSSPPRGSFPSLKSSGQPGNIRTMASTMIPGLSTPVPEINNINIMDKEGLMKLIVKSSKLEREKAKLDLAKSLKRAAEIELEDSQGSEYILAKSTYDKLSAEVDQISNTLLSTSRNPTSTIEHQNVEYARALYEDKYGKVEQELRGDPITVRFVIEGKRSVDIKTFDKLHLSSAIDALRKVVGKDIILRSDASKKYSLNKTLKENGVRDKERIHMIYLI